MVLTRPGTNAPHFLIDCSVIVPSGKEVVAPGAIINDVGIGLAMVHTLADRAPSSVDGTATRSILEYAWGDC